MAKSFKCARLRWWRSLQKRWWLVVPLIIWELIKDRVSTWANDQIDQEAGRVLVALAKAIEYLAATPLAATIALAVLVLLGLFIHSYWIEQKTGPEVANAEKDTGETARARKEKPVAAKRDVWVLHAIFRAALGNWDCTKIEIESDDPKAIQLDKEMRDKLGKLVLAEFPQLALDGKLPIWAKGMRFSARWKPVPPEYWNEHSIDWSDFLRGDPEVMRTKSSVSPNTEEIFTALMTSRLSVEELWPVNTEDQELEQLKNWTGGRIPLLRIYKIAQNEEWDFLSRNSLHALDFALGLRQAAVDGAITFWGLQTQTLDSLTMTEPLRIIPAEHWHDYQLDATAPVKHSASGDSEGLIENNFLLRTYTPLSTKGGFSDIHVNEAEARKWLEYVASDFMGKYEQIDARSKYSGL